MAGMSDEAKRPERCANALQHVAEERNGSVSDESSFTNDGIVKREPRLSANRLARRGATERPAFSGWREPAGAKRRLAGE